MKNIRYPLKDNVQELYTDVLSCDVIVNTEWFIWLPPPTFTHQRSLKF